MRIGVLMLSAATFLAVGGAVRAAPVDRDVGAYLRGAHAAAAARAAASGASLRHGMVVRGHVSADGHIYDAHVIGSSGSLDGDIRVERALRRLKTPEPPVRVIGAAVTMSIDVPRLALNADDGT